MAEQRPCSQPEESPYPPSVRTPIQRKIFDCVRCLLSRDDEFRMLNITQCQGISNPATHYNLEKLVSDELIVKEVEPDPHSRGGKKVTYTVHPEASFEIVEQADCPTLERQKDPLELIPPTFTPEQRRLIGCMACMHKRYGDGQLLRAGITTPEARECADVHPSTATYAFSRARDLGLIRKKSKNGKVVAYRATEDGKRLFEALHQEMTCAKETAAKRINASPRQPKSTGTTLAKGEAPRGNLNSDKSKQLGALAEWQLQRIMRYYPEVQSGRATSYLQLLYDVKIIRTDSLRTKPTLETQQARRLAIQNRTFDPATMEYVAMGPAATQLDEFDKQALLHVFGADIFVYGKRLEPQYLRRMLGLKPSEPLGDYAKGVLAKLGLRI